MNISTSIEWAYRLFLDREPENQNVVDSLSKTMSNYKDIRQAFLNSDEFRKNDINSRFVFNGDEPAMLIEEISDLQKLFFHIQKTWEKFGNTEPHWSVLSSENFKQENLEQHRNRFFDSGSNNVNTLFKTLERNGVDYSQFKECLEYGCGVGRVTYWLAKRFKKVIAYDISSSHLSLAQRYLFDMGIKNTVLHHLCSPQDIGNFPRVDIVYSVIVLQHNPPPIIALIIQELLKCLSSNGVAFFQVVTYRKNYDFSVHKYLDNVESKKEIEMHALPQKKIFEIIDIELCKTLEVFEDKWAGGFMRSNTFVIQKKS